MIRSDLLGDYGVESEEEIPDDLSYRLYKVTLSQLHETHLLSPPSTSEDQWEFLFGPPGAIVHDLMWVAVLHNQIQAVEALTPWIAFVGAPELQDLELRIVSTWAIISARLGYLDIADRLFKLMPCKQAVRDENAETFDEICRAAESGVQSSLQDGSRRSHSLLSRGSYRTSRQYQHEMASTPVDQPWKSRWSDRVLLRELKLPENLSLAPESLVGVTVISIPTSADEDEASIEQPSEDEEVIEQPREERSRKRQRH
ncbi:hypothetical protein IWQ60_001674 [Tieghemiomyces parasiticus]|uniref:Uncharacterized protein n=1 Tax=Tieghemiomyces parasiticus TaxID=78921 RepID=A0A9W8AE72_9FUNG|nr:hypothetical protein IWQ60_001674 [Tieghemiomyces parasiticus]